MPEEAQEPLNETTPDAPDQAASEETTADTPDVEALQKSYDELRSKFNERDTELSQFRDFYGQLADPETQAEALRQFGLELEAEEAENEEYQDPEEVLAKRLEGLEGYLAQQQAEAQEAELADLQEQYLDQELGKLDAKLSDTEKDIVRNLAFAYEDNQGLPDVKAAYDAYAEATNAARERYLESKRAPKPETGSAGLEKIDLNDADARIKAAAQLMEAEAEE